MSQMSIPEMLKPGAISSDSEERIDTDILEPVIFTESFIRYELQNKGLLNPQIQYRTNGDSGSSDYASQKLQGQGTGESANYVSSKSHIDLSQSGGGKQAYAVSYIYPQSGEYRPALTYSMNTEDRITLFAGWRLDSVTEITSIEVLANTSGTITGTFTLSEIRL